MDIPNPLYALYTVVKGEDKMKIYCSADWHISATVPEAINLTEDEFFAYQMDTVKFVADTVKDDLLIIVGDITDVASPANSSRIVNGLLDNLPKNVIITLGNHCILGLGSKERALKEGIFGVLARKLQFKDTGETLIVDNYALHFNSYDKFRQLEHTERIPNKINVGIGHFMSFPKQVPFWGEGKGVTHEQMIQEYPEFDLFVVGDVHEPYLTDGKYLSPGAITLRTVNQKKFQPKFWCLEDGKFTSIDIPVDHSIISSEHIDVKKDKDMRFEAWAENTKQTVMESMNIEDNILDYCKVNQIRENTMSVLKGLIEKVKGEK